MEFFQDNVYAIYAVVVVVVVIFGMIIRSRQVKKANQNSKEDYCGRYPDAAKVYLTSKALITSEAVQVTSVNGDYPAMFVEKGNKSGFYVKPGENVIEVDYTYTRPGVMYKQVTKSTGVVKQQIEVEPYKSYQLGFDRKEEHFTFHELDPAELVTE